jgi:hypothetical protein
MHSGASSSAPRFTCKLRGFSGGPAWTRTRDLFLIRDKSVCRGCSLLFSKSCKVAVFQPTVVTSVRRCSRALSSNCRQLSDSLPVWRDLLPSGSDPDYSTHTATLRRVPVKHLGAKCSVVSGWCQKAPSQDQAFLTFLRFAGQLGACSEGLEPGT